MSWTEPHAWFGGLLATGLAETTDDPAALDNGGWWAVVVTYEGRVVCARFDDVRPAAPAAGAVARPATRVVVVVADSRGVRRGRAPHPLGHRGRGLLPGQPLPGAVAPRCRRTPTCAAWPGCSPAATRRRTPVSCTSRAPSSTCVSASPELFLRRAGDTVTSGPIKGTGADRGRPHREGPRRERHDRRSDAQRPRTGGSDRLGDGARAQRRRGAPRAGAPRLDRPGPAAQRRRLGRPARRDLPARFGDRRAQVQRAGGSIAALETVPRGPYCGAVGWVDADRRTCRRWRSASGPSGSTGPAAPLHFGTGAGITWGSDPDREWDETELKARRLLAVAARSSGRR